MVCILLIIAAAIVGAIFGYCVATDPVKDGPAL